MNRLTQMELNETSHKFLNYENKSNILCCRAVVATMKKAKLPHTATFKRAIECRRFSSKMYVAVSVVWGSKAQCNVSIYLSEEKCNHKSLNCDWTANVNGRFWCNCLQMRQWRVLANKNASLDFQMEPTVGIALLV